MASKEAPKIALDLYTGQRFRAKFQLNNLFKKHNNVVLGVTNAVEKVGFSSGGKRLQNECIKQFQLKWKKICPTLNVEDTH